MMIRSFAHLAFVCLALGCGGGGAPEAEEDHGHEDGHHGDDHEPGGSDPNVLRIERGMLRDLRVTVRAAESRPTGDAVSALGELRVNEDAYAEVGSSIGARVVRLLVAPGDVVRAGQPLIELESPDVGRARASLAVARARTDLARQTLERRTELSADQIVARRDLEAAQAEMAASEAESRAAVDVVSALGAGRGSGGRFVLSSPIEGTVIERAALRGQMIDAEHPLFVIADLRRLWLVVNAFERDALRARVGTTASVVFAALPGESVAGTITRIGSRVDPASRTIEVRVEIDNPNGVFRPGMSGTAHLPLGEPSETVVAVPIESIQRQPQGWCVFLPTRDEGVFEIRSVGRGRDLGSEVEVVSGLRAGERIVVDGAFLLKAEADKARGGGEEHHH